MPGRNSQATQGGYSSGSTTVNGISYPTDLVVSDRYNDTPAEYKAATSIEFVGEYVDNGNDTYIAYIVDGNNPDPNPASGGGATSCDTYRYGFNGKENDKDISEGGQDYGMRIYDGRLGKFLSVDPLTKKYPFYTPYQFAANSPLMSVDIDGLEASDNKNETEKQSNNVDKVTALEDLTLGKIEYGSNTFTWKVGNYEMQYFTGSKGTDGFWLAKYLEKKGDKDTYNYEWFVPANKFWPFVNNQEKWHNWYENYSLLTQGVGSSMFSAWANIWKNPMSYVVGANVLVGGLGSTNFRTSLNTITEDAASTLKKMKKFPGAVITAELPNGGSTSLATSGLKTNKVAPQLKLSVDKLGGLGAESNGNVVGACAEFNAANSLLLENPGIQAKQINFSSAIRPKTGQIVARCKNCCFMFGEE